MPLSPAEYLDQTTRITRDGIYFGDEKIPGTIAENGVTLHPGGGNDINRLTVTFLVGPVEVPDPTVEQTTVESPGSEEIRYTCRRDSKTAGQGV